MLLVWYGGLLNIVTVLYIIIIISFNSGNKAHKHKTGITHKNIRQKHIKNIRQKHIKTGT